MLCGQDLAQRVLAEALAAAVAGPRLAVVTVRGVAGAGKTSLLRQFRRDVAAGTEPLLVGYTAANPGQDRQDFFARALAEIAQSAPAPGRVARIIEVVHRVAPAWLEVIPMVGQVLKAGYDTATAVREQSHRGTPLTEGFIRTIEDLATNRPVVLLLDDLHWADQPITDAVFELARTLAAAKVPVLVVLACWQTATTRDAGQPPVEQLVNRLNRHVDTTPIDLAPLDRDEVRAMATDVLGYRPPEPLVGWLQERSEGLPLFVGQFLRLLTERGLTDELPGLTPPELTRRLDALSREVPRTVEAVLVERLTDLDPAELSFFEAAAVVGEVFEVNEVAAVARIDEDGAEDIVDRAMRRGLIVAADGSYRLFHSELTRLLTSQLHGNPRRYARLHAHRADQLQSAPIDALDWYRRMAHHLGEADRPDDQLSMLEHARQAAEDRWQWREPLVDLLDLAAERFGSDGQLKPQARAVLMTTVLLNLLQRFDEAARAARTAFDLGVAAGDDRIQAEALGLRMGLESAGNPDFGQLKLGAEAVARYEQLGDDRARLGALFSLACVAMRVADWVAAETALDRTATLYEASPEVAGDPVWGGRIAQVRGELLGSTGRWAEAIAPLESALELARPVGTRASCAALGWHGLALAHTGRLDEGLAEVREALRIESAELGSREGAAKWLCLLAKLFLARGEPARAGPALWHAITLYEELHHTLAAEAREVDRELLDTLGTAEYGRLRERFYPTATEWSRYAFVWQLGPFIKHPDNPIMEPAGAGWESIAVLNPAAVADGQGVRMVYRAVGPGPAIPVSTLGLAVSTDGLRFRRVRDRPVLAPTEPFELPGGCEDPRLARVDNEYLLTYTGYDGHVARLATAWSRDLYTWHKSGPAFTDEQWHTYFPTAERPENPVGWTKSGALIPHKINGRWWMYFGDTHIWVAWSEDCRSWRVIRRPVLSPRPGCFDSHLVEPGPAPVVTPAGLVLIYNSADDDLRYAVGQALIDPEDPTHVLRRAGEPTLEVQRADEVHGVVSNVVFASGLVQLEDRWLLYYGMADTRIGAAIAPVHRPASPT